MAPKELYFLDNEHKMDEGSKNTTDFIVQCLKCVIRCSNSERNEPYLQNLISDGAFRREWIQMMYEVELNRHKRTEIFGSEKFCDLLRLCNDWLERLEMTIYFVEDLGKFLKFPSAKLRATILDELR